MKQKKIILGISSTELTTDEINLFKAHNPYGIILFKRNCSSETQLKALTAQIKVILPECKIFIDQEGGRVARLRIPNFIEFPSAASLVSKEDVYQNYYKMGLYLKELGIDVNCAPVADLFFPEADKIIGDRSFGSDPEHVISFARSAANGLLDSGIIPVIKHIPGHGRAMVDSHLDLPIIEQSLKELEETDFFVFEKLNDLPMAMTAHVIYSALDPEKPVSISKPSINYIRNKLGFSRILISDDLNMKALKGNLPDLAQQVLDAGCDFALHCSGDFDEMKAILDMI